MTDIEQYKLVNPLNYNTKTKVKPYVPKYKRKRETACLKILPHSSVPGVTVGSSGVSRYKKFSLGKFISDSSRRSEEQG